MASGRGRNLAIAGVVAGLLLVGLFAFRQQTWVRLDRTSPSPTIGDTSAPASSEGPEKAATLPPVAEDWYWVKPGFGGKHPITLTAGITEFVYYGWSPYCDYPKRHGIPMIWGKQHFYTEHVRMEALFDGPCNDGRPLLFLNEPAKVEQANISPTEAAHMFYTMTRSVDWPYSRWRGPIYAGNNLIEDQEWDAEFVRQFASLHNGGNTAIREISGWGVHLYGNYEYGSDAGNPMAAWTDDIPLVEISAVVDRSMELVDRYLAARSAEGNSTSLLATEFGLLQASAWHTPPAYFYSTTVAFMDEYVKRFDLEPQMQAWFWFVSTGSRTDFLDANMLVDPEGALTPNGHKWRELAMQRQLPLQLLPH